MDELDVASEDVMRAIKRRRDTLQNFLKILDANNQDQEPLRKERLIHFIETTVKFMNDVYTLLETQTLTNKSYTKRLQITIEMLD